MPTERIEAALHRRMKHNQGALLPCFTAGFPDHDATAELIRASDSLGASIVEIAVPFSDSIADGPVIRDSFDYSLGRGQSLDKTFAMISGLRASVDCGLVAMISYSIVHRVGVKDFVDRASSAGFDGVIVPDVPLEESAPMSAAARSAGLAYIGLVAPTTSPERREAISKNSTGFVYQIAVAGTTGERKAVSDTLRDQVTELRRVSGLPVCVGFGISTAQQVSEVCTFAEGAIVGSALINRVAEEVKKGSTTKALVKAVSELVEELLQGTTAARQ